VKVSEGFEWAYRDLLIALLVVFMAMAALALVAATKATRAGVTQGSLVVEMRWDRASNSDMDLWVEAPGDAPVGFSHMADVHCNLLRDDLGRALDPASANEEMVVCRGAPAGEWIVDAMLYRNYGETPLPVGVDVTVLRIDGVGVNTLLSRHVKMTVEGEQATIWRFTLNAKGWVVPGSVDDLPMALYGGPQ
jgi:hypothetical protein